MPAQRATEDEGVVWGPVLSCGFYGYSCMGLCSYSCSQRAVLKVWVSLMLCVHHVMLPAVPWVFSLYPVNACPPCMVVSTSRTDLQEPFVGGKLVGHPDLKWVLAKGESRTPLMGKVEVCPTALLILISMSAQCRGGL